jgi:hypothetical protein
MKFSKTILAAALAIATSSSFADTGGGALDLSTGSTAFSRTPIGAFTDTWTFSLVGSSFLTSSTLSSSAVGAQDLMFTSAVITTAADPSTAVATFSGPTFIAANEFMNLSNFLLPAGDYDLIVKGVNSADAAAYSGTITIAAAPIPEPETYALMMAGLGVLGFVARRRKAA